MSDLDPETRQDDSIPDHSQVDGSPPGGGPLFLVVGKFSRPHGVQGDILFQVLSDFPERLKPGKLIYIGEEHRPLRIYRRKVHSAGLILGFEEYADPEAVTALRGRFAYVTAEGLPQLPEGEYYHHELLGLRVVDEEGNFLGRLTQIIENPANDVYIVRPEKGPEILLPAIEPVILEIDLVQGVMSVHLLPGLLPD